MYKKALIVVAALWLLTVVAVLAAPATHTPGGMTHFEFLIAVLNDANDRDLVEDTTSDLLSTWFVENAIAPNTGETPQQARTRIAGGTPFTRDTPTPIPSATPTATPTVTPTPTPTMTPTPAPPDDRPALVALYNATNGANWKTNTKWLTNAPIGEWHGVTTDGAGRVTNLNLHSNSLAGTLPHEIGDLDRMRELVLWNNDITGSVPYQVGYLTRLTKLWLSSNQFSGALPSRMSDLTRLKQLRLSGNRFTGCVPPGLRSVADNDVASLGLSDCSVTPTPTPTPTSSSDDRAALVRLYEYANGPNWRTRTNWVSSAPIGQWHGVTTNSQGRVTSLDLSGNGLTGYLPRELGKLSELQTLDLSTNDLVGGIPPEFGNLSELRTLNLSFNELVNDIPDELGNLSELRTLNLSSNDITDEIPYALDTLSNLRTLDLASNNLVGAIPSELGALSNLEKLWLPYNQLQGQIPSELGALSNLTSLFISGNRLAGCVPDSLRSVTNNDFSASNLPFCAP